MKPYEEVCFPSGILRWTRENNLYVCRLTEDQMNEIKEIHETPYTKTYSGGKPNYTQPDEAMMKRVMDGIPDMPIKAKIEKEPTIDGWPLYSGLPPIKVQDKTFEEFAQSFAQSARVNGIPEPEPVAYINVEERKLEWATPIKWETPTVVKMDKVPLYTAPLQREPKPEPVAYLCENAVGHKYFRWKKPQSVFKPIALYTAPPQREWVGLTDEELLDLADMAYANDLELLQTLQAKLKEKNNG